MKRRRALTALLLVIAYACLALLFTYPLVHHLGTHYVGEDGGDARVYLWNFWWIEKALFELHTTPFETEYLFHPLGIGLALHTLGFLQGLEIIPLRAIFGAPAAVNLLVLWTFVGSAAGAYALARHLGARPEGAFLAGLVYGYCPYRLARLAGHYDLLGTEWLPFYALALLKAIEGGRPRWGWTLLAGLLAAATGYTALSYLAFLAVMTALVMAHALGRRTSPARDLLLQAGGMASVAALALSPLLFQLHHDLSRWTYPPYPGAERYRADVASYFLPGPGQTLAGPVMGRAFDPNLTETIVFPGYFVLALLLAALLHRETRRRHALWLLVGGVFFLLSLGNTLAVAGWETGVPLPFAGLARLPLFDQMRAPARFSLVVMLALAVIGAALWSFWLARVRDPARRWLATSVVAALVAAEYLAIPTPLFAAGASSVYETIGEEPGDFAVVEIPGIEQVPGRVMFHQTIHEKRILMGTAARVPREKQDYFFGLHFIRPLVDLRKGKLELTGELIEQERAWAPEVARFLDLRFLVIDRSYEKRGVLAFVESVLPVERAFEDGSLLALRVQDAALPGLPWSLGPGTRVSRMYYESGWSRPETEEGRSFRWADALRSTILFRRPSSEVERILLVVAPLAGGDQELVVSLGDRRLGAHTLRGGWVELGWDLPPLRALPARGADPPVERLELQWSELRRASERDPRRLAGRLAGLRFEANSGRDRHE